ncbi:MAG: GAF domain-containing protein [Caldilineae bacterium]|nr:MAG: GAF domain-containing protein [Caldilineae bacterium]
MAHNLQTEIESHISPRRMRLLLNVATAVSRSLDPQKVASVALQLALEAMGLDMGMVVLFQQRQVIVLASQGFAPDWLKRFQSIARQREETIIGRTLEAGHPQVIPNLKAESHPPTAALLSGTAIRSLACLPLQVPGNVTGVMLIGGREERQFSPADMEFLEAIAVQIHSGLRNAWLYAQAQRQLQELQSVTEAARAVISSRNLDQILSAIMEEVTARIKTEAASLLLVDSVRQELEFAAVAGPEAEQLKGIRIPLGQGIVGWVAQHNQPLLIPDVEQDERFFRGLDRRTKTVTRSVLCVPLCIHQEVIGVVEVINKRHGSFTGADLRLLESLATLAAVAIDNARFYEEANKQLKQATLYAHDLTVTFKQERKQRKALDRLRYSFLNVVSHELKTPLTVILQGLEALKNPKRGSLNVEQADIVDTLSRQSHYLERLIDGLITFATFSAKQGTMKFEPTPFDAVLDEALALVYFKATRKNITLDDRRASPLPTLRLDGKQMAEAIGHLLDNAIKFSPPGETVTLQTDTEDGWLTVRISDRGPGIPADQIDSIWDGFTQMNTSLERGLEGLGLGLAIARYIVEAHNGRIAVQSEAGHGATFTLRLPHNPSAEEMV